MKVARTKIWALVVSVMLPGFFTWSCSGMMGRELRDATVAGASSAVQARVDFVVTEVLIPDED